MISTFSSKRPSWIVFRANLHEGTVLKLMLMLACMCSAMNSVAIWSPTGLGSWPGGAGNTKVSMTIPVLKELQSSRG